MAHCLWVVFVFVRQEFFRVVVAVGAGLSVVEVWWGDPFSDAVGAFTDGPALFSERVIGSTRQGQCVDIGAVGICPLLDMMDFTPVAGHIAAGAGATTVFGVQHDSLTG